MIFVFGSNEAGRHGKGAALFALENHGAIYGQGVGRQGNSYAIPTKNGKMKILHLIFIKGYLRDFLEYAESNPNEEFGLTPIGTGLAGYKKRDIVRLLNQMYIPTNVYLTREWIKDYEDVR